MWFTTVYRGDERDKVWMEAGSSIDNSCVKGGQDPWGGTSLHTVIGLRSTKVNSKENRLAQTQGDDPTIQPTFSQ